MNIITIVATIFAAGLILGGGLQIIGNIKNFEDVTEGSGMVFFGVILLLLCYGWKSLREFNNWVLVYLLNIIEYILLNLLILAYID